MNDTLAPVFVNRPILSTPILTVGEFQCTLTHPRFEDSGPIAGDCFVFPRLPVAIQHEHEPVFVANTTVVTLYNAGQAYRRAPISPKGDHCDWFALDRELTREIVAASDPAASDAAQPFRWTRRRSDARLYFAQRALTDAIRSGAIRDTAAVEETAIWLLDGLVSGGRETSGRRDGRSAYQAVYHVEKLLSLAPQKRLSLMDLSLAVGVSVFHLCRAFRRITGRTIAGYRQQLRLRAALDEVREGARPLVDIALDAGFCSHSHFGAAFRREFGVTPSHARIGGTISV